MNYPVSSGLIFSHFSTVPADWVSRFGGPVFLCPSVQLLCFLLPCCPKYIQFIGHQNIIANRQSTGRRLIDPRRMAMPSCFGINRFHACVLLCWQFAIFFASQMLFPIFSNFVPRWRCNVTANFSPTFDRDCAAFSQCPEGSVEFEPGLPFRSAALEFDWICGPSAYKRALFRSNDI